MHDERVLDIRYAVEQNSLDLQVSERDTKNRKSQTNSDPKK